MNLLLDAPRSTSESVNKQRSVDSLVPIVCRKCEVRLYRFTKEGLHSLRSLEFYSLYFDYYTIYCFCLKFSEIAVLTGTSAQRKRRKIPNDNKGNDEPAPKNARTLQSHLHE